MTGPQISFENCRPVEEDGRQVMAWRNDPVTRAMSYRQEPKEWAGFQREYRDYFRFSGSPLPLFALEEGRRVGFVRFLPIPHPQGLKGRVVEVSIQVAPECRGRKLGQAILAEARPHLAVQGVDSIYAEVKEGNVASLKAFRAAGFDELGAAVKRLPETGEECPIHRFVAELTPAFWRRRPVYVIAEAGLHWRTARALIDAAAEAGADAVAFQAHRPETVGAADAGIREEVGPIFADPATLGELAEYCRGRNIDFLGTGLSPAGFAALDLFVAVHRVASCGIGCSPLLELAARSGKPLILSVGASLEDDIARAVDTYRAAGGRDLCLMQGASSSSAPVDRLNLGTLPWLQRRFAAATGLSDHGGEPALAPVVAVALGARAIEKRFTLDDRLPGTGQASALTPAALHAVIRQVRLAEASLGGGVEEVPAVEREGASIAHRGGREAQDR